MLDSRVFSVVQSDRNTSEAEAHRRLLPREEAALLQPLLRLRQACCHPQVPLAHFPPALSALYLDWPCHAWSCAVFHCRQRHVL